MGYTPANLAGGDSPEHLADARQAVGSRGLSANRIVVHERAVSDPKLAGGVVRSERIAGHRMHAERYEIPPATAAAVNAARAAGRPVTAVGTTSLRALESAARDGGLAAGSGET